MGWEKGKGLGNSFQGSATHIKVAIKRDNTGLGAKKRKGNNKYDIDIMGDGDEFIQGLDMFQKILGKLNGKDEAKLERTLEMKRQWKVSEICMKKYGMVFVYGGLLEGTIDENGKIMNKNSLSDSNTPSNASKSEANNSKKRKASDLESEETSGSESEKKSKDKKEKKSKKDKKSKKEKKDKKEKKEKKDKKEKKESKSKKEKKEKGSKSGDEKSIKATEKELTPSEEKPVSVVPQLKGIHATRARWIRTKRAATMDSKSLNEIFMVS